MNEICLMGKRRKVKIYLTKQGGKSYKQPPNTFPLTRVVEDPWGIPDPTTRCTTETEQLKIVAEKYYRNRVFEDLWGVPDPTKKRFPFICLWKCSLGFKAPNVL